MHGARHARTVFFSLTADTPVPERRSSARSSTSPAYGAGDPWGLVPQLLDLLPARLATELATPLRRSAAAQKKWQWLSKRLVTRMLGTTAARHLTLAPSVPPPKERPESSGADAIFLEGLVLGDNLDAIVTRVAEAAVSQRMPFPDMPGQPGGTPAGSPPGKDDAIAALKLRLLVPEGLPTGAVRRSSEAARGPACVTPRTPRPAAAPEAIKWGMPNMKDFSNLVSPLQEEFAKISRKVRASLYLYLCLSLSLSLSPPLSLSLSLSRYLSLYPSPSISLCLSLSRGNDQQTPGRQSPLSLSSKALGIWVSENLSF